MGYIISLLIAAFAGATMAVQGTFNSVLSKFTGLLEATVVVHVIGTLSAVLAGFALGLAKGDYSKVTSAPWYVFLGGILSVVIVYTVAASISKVGVSIATTAIIVGQTLTALCLDHFGCFGIDKIPFTWWRGVGLVLLAAGAKLLLTKGN